MTYRIKDWHKFQHFKDRRPPWIKLYRDILDDPDWHDLNGEDAKILVMLWIIASEDKNKKGELPELKKLSFKLRITEKLLFNHLQRLCSWVINDDIATISQRYRNDAPETETETETETEARARINTTAFEQFWNAYPKKRSKGDALKAWNALKPDASHVSRILAAVAQAKKSYDWQKNGGQYIPYPATWLRAQGWEDVIPPSSGEVPQENAEAMAKKKKELEDLAEREWERRQKSKLEVA